MNRDEIAAGGKPGGTLGNLYDRGLGTEVDFRRARDYYSRAASKGHKVASMILQRMVGAPPLEGILNDPFKGLR